MAAKELIHLHAECELYFNALWGDESRPLVFGDGNDQQPPLMLIGEAPGEQEALQRKPFVGKAGKNLTAFLEGVDLARSDLYISNVVKIRPSKTSKAGRIVNRPPTTAEIELFLPWLYREIALVRPKRIVTLGNVALHAFIPGQVIGQCHGQWQQIVVEAVDTKPFRVPLYPLYHPASVIYNRALTPVYQQDLDHLRTTMTAMA